MSPRNEPNPEMQPGPPELPDNTDFGRFSSFLIWADMEAVLRQIMRETGCDLVEAEQRQEEILQHMDPEKTARFNRWIVTRSKAIRELWEIFFSETPPPPPGVHRPFN
ncbi:MAG: hypothetical protein AMXMBFR33_60400 [Candidatus Xenobia bacterium]